jgi:hypothetical protein
MPTLSDFVEQSAFEQVFCLDGHLFGPFRSIGSQPRRASDYPAQLFCFGSNCRQVEGDVANSC